MPGDMGGGSFSYVLERLIGAASASATVTSAS